MSETIHFIITGGTIDSVNDERQLYPTVSNVRHFMETRIQPYFHCDYTVPFLKDSLSIDDNDRKIIADIAKETPHQRIVISHGSDTVVQTAQYLKKLHLSKVIILTCSFYFLSENFSDGEFNLGFACASALYARPGVYVAVNGGIFDPDKIVKNHTLKKFEFIERAQ